MVSGRSGRFTVMLFLMVALLLAAIPLFPSVSAAAAAKDTFTIAGIEPAGDGKTVWVRFSAPVRYDDLKGKLSLKPFAGLDWRRSYQDDETTIVLAGRFKKKTTYSVVLPAPFTSNSLTYKPTITTFQVGYTPPQVGFADTRTVIERDSRQMLHTSLTNTNELVLKGLALPPVMAPIAVGLIDGKQKDDGTATASAGKKKAKKKRRGPSGPDEDATETPVISYSEISGQLKKAYAGLQPQLAARGIPQIMLGSFVEESQAFLPMLGADQQQRFSIPLTFRTAKEKGAVELLTLAGKDSAGRTAGATRLFRITDIGITYKVSTEGLLVWTTAIGTGKPLGRVRCLGYLADNTFVDLGATDEKGVLVLRTIDAASRIIPSGVKPKASPAPADMAFIIAATADDVTYVAVNTVTSINPKGIETIDPRAAKAPLLKGSVFTERGMYRPGDKVHFKGTVRQYRDKGVNLPSIKSVRFTITNSKDETIYSREQALSEFGAAADTLSLEAYYPLGAYTIKMIMPGQAEQSTTFEVQEFKAPRHFVEIEFKRKRATAEGYVNVERTIDILNCTIHGKYYAGGPVKNGKVRWKVAYTTTSFPRKELPEYIFGSAAGAPDGIIESGETTLDEKGVVTVSLPIAKEVAAGLYGVEMTASVIDFDGKVSTDTARHQEAPAYLVGISPHRTSIERGDAQALKIVVLTRKGTRIDQGKVTAEIMRRDYTYLLKRNDQGNAFWERNDVYMKEVTIPLKITKGGASFEFDFTRAGTYVVKFTYTTKDGKSYASSTQLNVDYGSYRWYDDDENAKFERLPVQADKTTYAVGETMRVYVSSRRQLASLLMTIEREGVLEHSVVNLKPGQKYIDIPVQERFGPNVYISFLGITARGEFPLHSTTFDAAAPDFLYGTTRVTIRQKPGTLTLAINPGEQQLVAEPGTKVTLNLSAKDYEGKGVETEMAVAVVDESVLALTRFQTPSLDSLASFTVPLGVLTGELRTELLKQTPYGFLKNRRLTGGDGAEGGDDAGGKLRRDFRPVAYYNPALHTGSDGTAQVSFTLPDSMTTYRVYVVACDRKDRFASFQRSLLAKRHFYVEPGTPRFFTKGDRFTFYVSAFNKTDQAGMMQFVTKGDARLALSADPSVALKAQDRYLVPVKGEAVQAGLSTIRVSGEFLDKKDAVELKIPVKSGSIRWNDVLYGTLQGDTSIRYDFPKEAKDVVWSAMDPGEVQAVLTVSSSPFYRLSRGLRYLLDYPYGCVEQTSSRIIPLAALRTLISEGLIAEIMSDDTDTFLRPGIERLLSMQVGSGGFAYWPGQREASDWGSIYAITALTRARLAGFDVPSVRMDRALAYLEKKVKERDKPANENAFALYLLAMNKKLDRQLFMDVYRNIDKMSRQSGLLMMLAAQSSGHLGSAEITARTRTLLNGTASQEYGDFYAVYREPAIALMAANTILKDDALAGKLAKGLLDGTGNEGRWGSTSDTGWALLALGEYFKGKSFTTRPVAVTVEQPGQAAMKATVTVKTPLTTQLDAKAFLASPTVRVAAPQGVDLAYSLSLTFPRIDWAGKGASKGIKVAKKIEQFDGNPVIRVGDIVRVTVALQVDSSYNYIVLDDPLPAGLVAINTAIKTEEQVGKKRGVGSDDEGDEMTEGGEGEADAGSADSASSDQDFDVWGGGNPFYPNHFELRDDRVLAFRDQIWSGVYEYSYYARAVCEGQFVMPQTKAQLMYRPEVVGYTPLGSITIKPRQ